MPTRVLREIRSGEEIIQLAVRLGLLAFLLYWSFVLVRPFIPIFAWSVVLAVALYPAFNWLSVHLGGRPKLAAAIITSVNLAIVIGPATWVAALQLVPSSSISVTWRTWWGPRPRSRRRTTSARAMVSCRALIRFLITSEAV